MSSPFFGRFDYFGARLLLFDFTLLYLALTTTTWISGLGCGSCGLVPLEKRGGEEGRKGKRHGRGKTRHTKAEGGKRQEARGKSKGKGRGYNANHPMTRP